MNTLYYGDNLQVLREFIPTESVDLVYLDPPFNSSRGYNVIFSKAEASDKGAQIQAFDDTWTWANETERLYQDLVTGGAPGRVADALVALRGIHGTNDLLAYLVMMAPRLVELHRVLKDTGTLYLHCDPTASHYLKVLLDVIFGGENFRNEIVWTYKFGARGKNDFGKKHDIIFRYTKSKKFTFNSKDPLVRAAHEPASLELNFRHVDENGRRYREGTWSNGKKYRYYADEGRLRDDVFTDINSLHQASPERLGYPTQKPVRLLEVLIAASSNPGDVVLDPFCGCGTTVDAAQKLQRQWVGIDVTFIAIDLIVKRFEHTYGPSVLDTFTVAGIPRDVGAAQALFDASPFDFERWAVSLVRGTPNSKQVADTGIDGVIRFSVDKNKYGKALVSVKGGRQLNPGMVRDLIGTVEANGAEMGVLVTLHPPTKGMVEAANKSGLYVYPMNGENYPKIQLITVEQLLSGENVKVPLVSLPYIAASPRQARNTQMGLAL